MRPGCQGTARAWIEGRRSGAWRSTRSRSRTRRRAWRRPRRASSRPPSACSRGTASRRSPSPTSPPRPTRTPPSSATTSAARPGSSPTLVDSVLYLESVELIEELASVPPGDERRRALFRLHQTYARELDSYQMFYELIPHILRDEELRPHLRALFDWYRKLDAWALGAQAGTDHPATARAAGSAHGGDRRRRRAAGAGRPRPGHRPGLRDLAPADHELPRRRRRLRAAT